MHLRVDGIPGEETLMQLMRDTNTTPSVLLQTPMPHRTRKRRRSIPNVYHLSCGSAQLRFREAVWFSYRIPRLRKIASNAF